MKIRKGDVIQYNGLQILYVALGDSFDVKGRYGNSFTAFNVYAVDVGSTTVSAHDINNASAGTITWGYGNPPSMWVIDNVGGDQW